MALKWGNSQGRPVTQKRELGQRRERVKVVKVAGENRGNWPGRGEAESFYPKDKTRQFRNNWSLKIDIQARV